MPFHSSPTCSDVTGARWLPDAGGIMAEARHLLRTRFGYENFRPGQEEVIRTLLTGCTGGSAVAVLPTGGGKSLCYQLPALLYPEGVTLVIMPTVALMDDQLRRLSEANILAARVRGTTSDREWRAIVDNVEAGALRVLVTTPEGVRRLARDRLRQVWVALLVIDEAHCIFEWGMSFRPDYLRLRQLAKSLGNPPVLAMTATASHKEALALASHFGIAPEAIVRTPFRRPNLRLSVIQVPPSPMRPPEAPLQSPCERRLRLLESLLGSHQRGPTLVYVNARLVAERLTDALVEAGFPAAFYHSGMTPEKRSAVQAEFFRSPDGIVVSTSAFSLGVDKADVRLVVHFELPRSAASYSQEIGRAGRDGRVADCVALLCPDDVPRVEGFSYTSRPTLEEVRSFLAAVFPAAASPGAVHEVTLTSLVQHVDETVVHQLLTAMELDPSYGFLDEMHPRWLPEIVREGETSEVPAEATLRIVSFSFLLVRRPLCLDALAKDLHFRLCAITEEQLQRFWDGIELLTSDTCHMAGLAARFGTPAERAIGPCGHCSGCFPFKRPQLAWRRGNAADPVPDDQWAAVIARSASALPTQRRPLALHLCGMVDERTWRIKRLSSFGALMDFDYRAVLAKATVWFALRAQLENGDALGLGAYDDGHEAERHEVGEQ